MLRAVVTIGISRVLIVALAFASTATLTNVFGATAYGIYVAAATLTVVGATAAKWGWDGSAVRFIACALTEGERNTARQYARAAVRTVTIRGVFVAILVASTVGAAWFAGVRYARNLPFVPLVVAVTIPLTAVSLVTQGVLRGAKHPVFAEASEGIAKPIALVGTALSVRFAFGSSEGGEALLVGFVIACFASLWIGVRAVATVLGHGRIDVAPKSRMREWAHATEAHGLLNLCQTVIARAPLMVGAYLVPANELAVLAVAARLAESLQLGLTSVGLQAAPVIASLHHLGQLDRLKTVLRKAALLAGFTSLVGAGLMIVLGPRLLSMFGTDFTSGMRILVVLIAGQVVAGCCGPVGYLVTMTGAQRRAARILVTIAVAAVAGGLVFGHYFGVSGLATWSTLTLAASSLSLASLGRKVVAGAANHAGR